MSSRPTSRSPPILNLHSDLLWRVFDLNANLEDTRAFETLRHTSQVCADWRDLVLGSPSLWGKAIDIASLARARREWRVEVIRRTGTSRLHIRGILYSAFQEEVARAILAENWGRIRGLELQFNYTPFGEEQWRALFQRPAPSLETFMIVSCSPPKLLPPPEFALFEDNAPSLRSLRVYLDKFTLDVAKTSWASNLREMVISHSSIPASELLYSVFLVSFPFLEALELTDTDYTSRFEDEGVGPAIFDDGDFGPLMIRPVDTKYAHICNARVLHPVTLTRLTRIKLHAVHEVDMILSMMGNITPSEGCTLDFSTFTPSLESSSADVMGEIFQNYLRVAAEPDFDLEITRNSIEVMASGKTFRFHIDCRGGLPESAFQSCFSPSAFRVDELKTLSLKIDDYSEVLQSSAAVKQFIGTLISLEDLKTDAPTLTYLDMLQRNAGLAVFPSLKSIELCHASSIEGFLESRTALGVPVDTLTLLARRGTPKDITPLSKFPGLTVHFLSSQGGIQHVVVIENSLDGTNPT